jgi:hypothetical protein
VARVVDQTVSPDIAGDPLTALVSGLSSLNPELSKFVQAKNTNDAEASTAAGTAAAQKNELATMDPNKVIQLPESMPEKIDPALRPQFEKGYREALGIRIGEKLQGDLLDAWSKVRLGEDTDAEKFIREWTATNTAGINDPLVLEAVNKRHIDAVRNIRSDARSIGVERVLRSGQESINGMFGGITADMSTAAMASNYFSTIVPTALATGLTTRTELAGKLLDRLTALSISMGGAPELFDQVFKEAKDPATGRSLFDLNPKLAEAVEVARKTADSMVEQKLDKAMQPLLFQKRTEWDKRIANGDPPTIEEIKSEIGPRGLFKTDNEALAFYHHGQREAMKIQAAVQGVRYAQAGLLYLVGGAEEQAKVMDSITTPLAQQMFVAIQSPSPQATAAANVAFSQLLNAHQRAGASVPNTILKNAFATIRQMIPGKDAEPSPQFSAMANWYAQMPANLQGVYVPDEDTRTILDTFNAGRTGGPGTQLDPRSALQAAFTSVSPEAKRAADTAMKDPEFRAKTHKWVKGEVVDWYRFSLFGMTPTNDDMVFAAVDNEAQRLLRSSPHLNGNNSAIKGHLQKWVQERYVHDKTTNYLVEVPAGKGGDEASRAISEFMKGKVREYGEGAGAALVHMGNGVYQLRADGAAGNLLETGVTLDNILHQHRTQFELDGTKNERQRLLTLQTALVNGTATPEMLNAESALIGKAQAIKAWDKKMLDRVVEVKAKAFREELVPGFAKLPKGSAAGVDNSALPTTDRTKQDMAQLFWNQGQHGRALTVLGEGVVLKAYADNKGSAIGVGYNMTMNSTTLKEDFRRAGIPAESIEGIKAGKTSITTEQAMRLFEVSYSRAEASAKAGIENLYGKGAWDKLPTNRRGVLADVAYQAGSVTPFANTLQRFMAEAGSLDEQNLKVHYEDPKSKQMVPDVNRNNLRLNLLGGLSSFQAVIDQVKSKPRNAIEARAASTQ